MKNTGWSQKSLLFFRTFFFITCYFLLHTIIFAQVTEGLVSGVVVDRASKDGLFGVSIVHRQTNSFIITDADGKFSLKLPEGVQSIEFILTSYRTKVVKINVSLSKPVVLNIRLNPPIQNEIVVKTKGIRSTIEGLIQKRKKSSKIEDSISSEEIGKSSDSNAAGAASRVTGLTIVGGQFVFIRGLGERYSSISFNGATLPSPNPDRKIVSLDVFPSSLLSSLSVIKTFSANLAGDFSGGVLQLFSKELPEKQTISASVSSGYLFTEVAPFYTYSGSPLDIIGFSASSRERSLPGRISVTPRVSGEDDVSNLATSLFNNDWNLETAKNWFPLSLSLSYSNTFNITEESKVGILVTGLFKTKFENLRNERSSINTEGTDEKRVVTDLTKYKTSSGVLVGFDFFINSAHSIKVYSLFSHLSSDEARRSFRESKVDDDAQIEQIFYKEDSLFVNQILGEHTFANALGLELSWLFSHSLARHDEPDRRESQYERDADGQEYQAVRFIREFNGHEDQIYDFHVDFQLPFSQWTGLRSHVDFGVQGLYRFRDSAIRRFSWEVINEVAIENESPGRLEQDAESFFSTQEINQNFQFTEFTRPSDAYIGTHLLLSGFAQVELPLLDSLTFVGGTRVEYSSLRIEDGVGANLTRTDILPVTTIIYRPLQEVVLRVAYSRTITRPDFKEISAFQFTNVVDGELINGNPFLQQTFLHNADFRIDWFFSKLELISLSFFYKYLQNPIEIVVIGGSTSVVSFYNADLAHNLGFELEVRKNFTFIHETLKGLVFTANFSYIYSQINVGDTLEYYSSGSSDPRVIVPGSSVSNNRPLQGQAPWVLNAGLGYNFQKIGFEIYGFYNISGPSIRKISLKPLNDIYQDIVHRLDFVVKQNLYKGLSFNFAVSNVLDPEIQEFTEVVDTGERVVISTFQKGIDFSAKISYKWD